MNRFWWRDDFQPVGYRDKHYDHYIAGTQRAVSLPQKPFPLLFPFLSLPTISFFQFLYDRVLHGHFF